MKQACKSRRVVVCLGLFFVLLFVTVSLPAQTGTAVVLGRVTDKQGAVVPQAAVTATNVDTGVHVRVMTDSTGTYRIPGMFPGDYEVTAERASSAPEVRRGITLTVSQQAVVNFTLRLGATEQRVVVTGGPPLVETTSSAVSGVMTPTQMRQLPLNGRDIFQLVLLQPGVEPTPSAGPSPWQKGGLAKVSVNRQRPTSNNLMIDGT